MGKECIIACPPEGLTRSGKTHNLMEERKRRHAYQSPQKNIPLTVVTLAALGIMFFLFFMHPAPPEESLEFYAPDGNIAGSFRVEITNAPSNPAYTEVKSFRKTWNPSSGFGPVPQQTRYCKSSLPRQPHHCSGPGHAIRRSPAPDRTLRGQANRGHLKVVLPFPRPSPTSGPGRNKPSTGSGGTP